MRSRRSQPQTIVGLLEHPQIGRAFIAGVNYYCVTDLIGLVLPSMFPLEVWEELKKREPALVRLETWVDMERDGQVENVPAVEAAGVFRVIQSLSSSQAEKLKQWIAESALLRLEEQANPELALYRTRKLYRDAGYSKRWIDKRLRSISTRHELTSEWAHRGVTSSDEYRALTNALVEGAFGLDVQGLRRYKSVSRPGANLRDNMSDLELFLTSVAESVAVELHRRRQSHGLEELLTDCRHAGRIAAATRTQIEQAGIAASC